MEIQKIDKTFTYLIPSNLNVQIGIRCLVPFGNKKLEGFVVAIKDELPDEYKLKEIIDVIDKTPILNEELLSLGKYISKKTLCTLTSAYQTMLPTALKAKVNNKVAPKKALFIRKIDYKVENKTNAFKASMKYIIKTKSRYKIIYALRTSHIIERQFVPLYLFIYCS